MSFTWFADKPLRSREQIAREVHQVSISRNLDELATVMALMCISVESDFWCPGNMKDPCFAANPDAYPHDSLSDDGYSSGLYQQQMSGPGVTPPWGWGGLWGDPEGTRKRMDLRASTDLFLEALPESYRSANNATAAGEMIANVQQCAPQYRYRYATKWDEAWALLRRALDSQDSAPVESTNWFNEQILIGDFGNSSSRNGQKPRLIVLHTSEGAGGINLVNYMRGAQVSYHNVIDNNGDVWALVDTDRASWSVLNANPYTINYCFGASKASWTRNQWLQNHGNGIKIAAYLAAVDCKKYGIPPVVRVGNSASGYPSLAKNNGITDHYGITKGLGIGTHTDVGPGFPWDVFNQHLQRFYGNTEQDGFLMALSDAEQKELLDKTRFVFDELSKKFPSRSIYANPGEGLVDTVAGFVLNVDSMTHADLVEQSAKRGDEDSIMRIVRTAAGDGVAKDEWAIDRAKSALAEIPEEYLAAYQESHK